MTVEISTRDFEAAHGKQPRGRGSWGFCPANHYDAIDYLDHVKWFHQMTFAEARRNARVHFSTHVEGDTIVVCS